MRKLLKIVAFILSMLFGSCGGCALDVQAQRPGEALSIRITPNQRPSVATAN